MYFRDMEEAALLDIDSEVDIFCLHYCFHHIIAKELQEFRAGWNQHRIRTARNNNTPNRLFIQGLYNLANYANHYNVVCSELIQVKTEFVYIKHLNN